MLEFLKSHAEIAAMSAQECPSFGGLNLLHIKRQLALLLGLIGRNGIFDEYTNLDIAHIDAMLATLDWLIPDSTQSMMTPADWLLIVLAIYFHDLGMLVTKEEYHNRSKSGYLEFRDTVLFAGLKGKDYEAKVDAMPAEDAQRFLYQEFVRHKHAERIRAWVTGKSPAALGDAKSIMSAVDSLLTPLGVQFRRDLALVCESHHLDDLNNLKKYKTSQPYGNSDTETANVQYAAVLLRAADLLHITSDRTPSIVFKTINPSDPVSQQEWAKQMAVKRVRSKMGIDREGLPDEAAPRDTIEVFAYFEREEGFFGLTSYLRYATDEIGKCNDWIHLATKANGSKYTFPWRKLDDSNIEALGFLRETFEFPLDQAKILDLLTGHTLYNDTSVVVRELVQNSLDAVRLRLYQESQSWRDDRKGTVQITWDSKLRTLSVTDSGTGMTQDIIEKHLLRVGSSRYQDPEFQKQNPNFSPISRFGIGVLSNVHGRRYRRDCHPPSGRRPRQATLFTVGAWQVSYTSSR